MNDVSEMNETYLVGNYKEDMIVSDGEENGAMNMSDIENVEELQKEICKLEE